MTERHNFIIIIIPTVAGFFLVVPHKQKDVIIYSKKYIRKIYKILNSFFQIRTTWIQIVPKQKYYGFLSAIFPEDC